MRPRILVIGRAAMGLSLSVDSLPAVGHTSAQEQFRYTPAGQGLNTAVAISRLGGDPILCSKIGTDSDGRQLVSFLASNNVDTRFLSRHKDGITPLSVRICEGSHLRLRVIDYPGAEAHFTAEDALEALTSMPDSLIVPLSLGSGIVLPVIEKAAAMNIPVFADACGCPPDFPFERLPKLLALVIDAAAAKEITGIEAGGAGSMLKVCLSLEKAIRSVFYILKLGDRGVFLYDGTYQKMISAYDVAAEDYSASDEAFMAAMTVSFIRSVDRDDPDMEHACTYANLASALTKMKIEAAISTPTAKEIANLAALNSISLSLAPDEMQ